MSYMNPHLHHGYFSDCLELAYTVLVIEYSEQFVCEEWRLECQQKGLRRKMSTKTPEDDSGERGYMSREAEGDRAGGLMSRTGLGCETAGPQCHLNSLKAA